VKLNMLMHERPEIKQLKERVNMFTLSLFSNGLFVKEMSVSFLRKWFSPSGNYVL
jgi:hypothetical protein